MSQFSASWLVQTLHSLDPCEIWRYLSPILYVWKMRLFRHFPQVTLWMWDGAETPAENPRLPAQHPLCPLYSSCDSSHILFVSISRLLYQYTRSPTHTPNLTTWPKPSLFFLDCCHSLLAFFFFSFFLFWDFIYLFLERGERRKRGRETSIGFLSHAPAWGLTSSPDLCPDENGTSDLLFCGTTPNPLNHTSQGKLLL